MERRRASRRRLLMETYQLGSFAARGSAHRGRARNRGRRSKDESSKPTGADSWRAPRRRTTDSRRPGTNRMGSSSPRRRASARALRPSVPPWSEMLARCSWICPAGISAAMPSRPTALTKMLMTTSSRLTPPRAFGVERSRSVVRPRISALLQWPTPRGRGFARTRSEPSRLRRSARKAGRPAAPIQQPQSARSSVRASSRASRRRER